MGTQEVELERAESRARSTVRTLFVHLFIICDRVWEKGIVFPRLNARAFIFFGVRFTRCLNGAGVYFSLLAPAPYKLHLMHTPSWHAWRVLAATTTKRRVWSRAIIFIKLFGRP